MKHAKTTVKYGGLDVPVMHSTDPLVPTDAIKVSLTPQDKKALAIALIANKPALLVGETGTGKTSAVRELAYLTKRPYVRVNMTGFTTPDELIGSKSVKDGATYYEHGIVTDAMQRGAILVLDEINATTPDCMFILHGLLDDDRRITLPNGDIITPHADFRVFATCNPDYEGTKAINKALLDRFGIILSVDTLSPLKETKLLVNRTGIPEDNAKQLVAVATMLRKDYAESKIGTFTSTRTLITIAELMKRGMDMGEAYTVSLVRKTQDKDERTILTDVFNSVIKISSDAGNDDEVPEITTRGELRRLKSEAEASTAKLQEVKDVLRTASDNLNKATDTITQLTKDAQEARAEAEAHKENAEKLAEQVKQYAWIEKRLKRLGQADDKGVTV